MHDLIDCYIERPNFGRDFGSYKTGFLHLYARGWDARCPRLLLINDSIFFNEERLPKFIDDMMESDTEVLGSTENFEIEHHLGSFCISVGAPVLRHARFRRYWRRYKLSDIRPIVIRRGEMGLTKVLRRCVSSAGQFRSLYGAARFAEEVTRDEDLLDFAVQNSRRSELVQWKRATPTGLLDYLHARLTVPTYDLSGADMTLDVNQNSLPDTRTWITSVDDLESFVEQKLTASSKLDPVSLRKVIAAQVAEIFMVGSHIHQNAVVLLHMGLPIVKLDALYRGIFNVEDINLACEQIGERDARELRPLLIERPYGGQVLFGWKRAAFERGLI